MLLSFTVSILLAVLPDYPPLKELSLCISYPQSCCTEAAVQSVASLLNRVQSVDLPEGAYITVHIQVDVFI